ncbi:MAG TPA: cholesterol oxidase substrate-binding domain-containing protein [Microthrixaceae bacterium]|nr:cholesterol oxidase substrate-binding domain-containing protein [Microthrixaceae bacterium]
MTDHELGSPRLSRRQLMGAGAASALGAAGLLNWAPAFAVPAGAASVVPPNFPSTIPLYQQAYRNWSGDIAVDALWTCAPRTPAEVVTVANWARGAGYKVRARGKTHNWSPLVVTPGSTDAKQILCDTTQYLTTVSVSAGSPATVTAQTGITMEALLTHLEQSGYGLTATPAPGQLTLGGVLAIDGHGTAVPANGETRVPGTTYGSISNLVTSLTAVVWDAASNQYVLRTFSRSDAAIRPLLTHIGRSFVTSVTLQVGANQRLRCQSWFDVPWTTMFGSSASASRSFSSYMNSSGRVEAIWFPFTDNPWLKVWSRSPSKPFFARSVSSPYNYGFSDNLSSELTSLIAQIVAGNGSLTPTFGTTQIATVGAGLISTGTWDIWGWSKNTLLYVRPTTLRVTANGYAVLTTRANVQRVVNEFATVYRQKLDAYRAQGRYPMNGPVEIRVTGLDAAADVAVPSAGPPSLSALRPRPDQPWDVAVWLDVLTVPGTPDANQFYRELEQWVYANYSGTYAAVRPEWSKGWGYSTSAAWSDPTQLSTTVPNAYRAGLPAGDNWDTARSALNTLDPHRIFTNSFLDTLVP